MIIYHGSEHIIEHPIYEFKNGRNDYGAGFYCTEHIDLAKEWACKKNTDGFANRYELNLNGLNILRLNSGDFNILNWVALLTKYRGYWQRYSIAEEAKSYLQDNFSVDISSADVIIGYRADDSYFSFVQDFISGTISLQQLSSAMRLGKLGEQIVLKSRKAFAQIEYSGCESAYCEEYYQKKTLRDTEARRSYAALKAQSHINDIYMIDIMRGSVKTDDICL